MENKEQQTAIELLKEYFATMPQEVIWEDWNAVKDLQYEGPTVMEFL